MTFEAFRSSLHHTQPPANLPAPLEALWWDAKGNWSAAHNLVDHLETPEGMAVHAYLHRKEGEQWNADYWYRRSTKKYHRPQLAEEWQALIQAFLT